MMYFLCVRLCLYSWLCVSLFVLTQCHSHAGCACQKRRLKNSTTTLRDFVCLICHSQVMARMCSACSSSCYVSRYYSSFPSPCMCVYVCMCVCMCVCVFMCVCLYVKQHLPFLRCTLVLFCAVLYCMVLFLYATSLQTVPLTAFCCGSSRHVVADCTIDRILLRVLTPRRCRLYH